MNSSTQRSSLKFIALALLVAMAMGGAWVGFYSGGVPDSVTDTAAVNDISLQKSQDQQAGIRGALDRFINLGEGDALDSLLPLGISDIDGQGGRGLQRQVRKNGLWFPVFDLSRLTSLDTPDLDQIRLNEVPLMIVTPHPAAVRVDEWLSHQFKAVGGTPPYSWNVEIEGEAAGFTLNAETGEFTGMSETPLSLPMSVYVTDAAEMQASATTSLIIGSAEPLVIVTTDLPAGAVGQPYQAQLVASGGAVPYNWTLSAAPEGWACGMETGLITGSFNAAEECELRVIVTDSITQVERVFKVRAEGGLDINTPSPLAPAAPGAYYSGVFQATGGTPPYRWEMTAGQLPSGWGLAEDGSLTGMAPELESRHEFGIRVTDTTEQTFEKTFQLSISKGLLVIPSREKAGLAWQYEAMQAALGNAVKGVSLKRNGTEVYRGQGTNVVDGPLVTGMSYSYELTALLADGTWMPYAAAVTTLLPMSTQRGQPGVRGDPYADKVVSYAPLSGGGYGSGNMPGNVTGPPDGASTFTPAYLPNHVLSLHATKAAGGSVVLEFADNIVAAGSGLDFTVFENVLFKNNDPNQRFMEPAIVEVALFEGQWFRFPFRVSVSADGAVDLVQPAYYSKGFAGVNATTGDDPTDPTRSGGDSFDLAALGRPDLQWFRFIRLIATGDGVIQDGADKAVRHTAENNSLSGNASSGFDLDAVSAVNY